LRTRDWFFTGVAMGLVYGLLRYPGACGCLALAVVLLVLILAVGLIATIGWFWSLLGVAAVVALIVSVARQRPPPER
jgi:hypothetical protein